MPKQPITFDDWIAQNPLEKWIRQSKIPRVRVSSILHRGNNTVYLWRNGNTMPSKDEDWYNLKELTGNENIKEEWREWYEYKERGLVY